MITLAVDTSTPRGSVAVFAYGDSIFEETFLTDRSHSSALFVSLKRARECSRHFDQVAIGLGPGSYSGVRVAIAAALGFELALGAKLVGIPSVAVLETSAHDYIAIGDARRETFYFTKVIERLCVDGPRLVSESELRGLLENSPLQPCYATTALAPFPSVLIASPSAAILASLADAGKSIVATGNLEPLYLREPHITQPKARPR